MKLLIVLVVMVAFLYGIEAKTLATENEMLNKVEESVAADIEKMPAESEKEEVADLEDTEEELQQAPLEEEEYTDEVEQEEADEEVTANGCVVTKRVCGLFYQPKYCKKRQCFTVRAAATRPIYKQVCKRNQFKYNGHPCSNRQCFKVKVGIKIVYVKARKCYTCNRFCGFKCVRKCKTVTFHVPSPSQVAQN